MKHNKSKVKRFFSGLFLFSFAFLGLAAGLLFSASSFAAIFNVTNSTELRDALTAAQGNGQEDIINIASGVYGNGGTTFTYSGASGENFSLTIIGAGAATTLLDGGNTTRVLEINTSVLADDSSADVAIMSLTIQNGNDLFEGGGLFVSTDSANTTIKDCGFNNNSTTSVFSTDGGGAFIFTISGAITLTNSIFDRNSAAASLGDANGGGASILAISGDIALINNIFSDNSAISSGFIFPLEGAFGGGAEVFSGSGSITLTNNAFNGNSAVAAVSDRAEGGGARTASSSGNIVLTNNVFDNNSVNGSSAGFSARVLGGGVSVSTFSMADITVTNNTFALNSASGDGGGLFASVRLGFAINIYNNIVRSNSATGVGDDIFIDDRDFFNITGSTVNLFNNDFSDFSNQCAPPDCAPNISQENNIDEDPLFIDAANGDFHIQSGSPVIDAGTSSTPLLPLRDFEGDPRVFNLTPDMGADEFVAFAVTCEGLTPTIVGTPGNDFINGTPGADIVNGLGGNDTIRGFGGNDIICGSGGNDIINGGVGDDRLFGMMGRDTVNGGDGNDRLFGGADDDMLNGGNGDDRMDGVDGTDVCDGGNGDDIDNRCETVTNVP